MVFVIKFAKPKERGRANEKEEWVRFEDRKGIAIGRPRKLKNWLNSQSGPNFPLIENFVLNNDKFWW